MLHREGQLSSADLSFTLGRMLRPARMPGIRLGRGGGRPRVNGSYGRKRRSIVRDEHTGYSLCALRLLTLSRPAVASRLPSSSAASTCPCGPAPFPEVPLPNRNGLLIACQVVMLLGDAQIGVVQESRGEPEQFRALLAHAGHCAVAKTVRPSRRTAPRSH